MYPSNNDQEEQNMDFLETAEEIAEQLKDCYPLKQKENDNMYNENNENNNTINFINNGFDMQNAPTAINSPDNDISPFKDSLIGD